MSKINKSAAYFLFMLLVIAGNVQARPTNEQIVSWLNNNLSEVQSSYFHKKKPCGPYDEDFSYNYIFARSETIVRYRFFLEGKVLGISEAESSKTRSHNCMSKFNREDKEPEKIVKIDLSALTTIEKSGLYESTDDRSREYVIDQYSAYLLLKARDGKTLFHLVTGTNDEGNILAEKVRNALNDLILNNGGSQPLY